MEHTLILFKFFISICIQEFPIQISVIHELKVGSNQIVVRIHYYNFLSCNLELVTDNKLQVIYHALCVYT